MNETQTTVSENEKKPTPKPRKKAKKADKAQGRTRIGMAFRARVDVTQVTNYFLARIAADDGNASILFDAKTDTIRESVRDELADHGRLAWDKNYNGSFKAPKAIEVLRPVVTAFVRKSFRPWLTCDRKTVKDL